MKDKPMSAGIILMMLMLAGAPLLAGCGDFWEAPAGKTGTTATTTALTVTQNGSTVTTVATGTSVTLTATVAGSAGSATPTGTVTFYSGTTSLGTGTLSAGSATLTTTFNSAGTFSLTADYGGDSTYATSTSTAVSLIVSAPVGTTASTTTLMGPNTTPTAGESFTLTATVAPMTGVGTPTGTVTFFNGATSLGTGTLNQLSPDTAILSVSFTAGTYSSLTATYGGDSTYATSTSTALSITVNP
jgi:hypothetical protein